MTAQPNLDAQLLWQPAAARQGYRAGAGSTHYAIAESALRTSLLLGSICAGRADELRNEMKHREYSLLDETAFMRCRRRLHNDE